MGIDVIKKLSSGEIIPVITPIVGPAKNLQA